METPPINNPHLSPEYIEALKKYTERTQNLNPVDLVHGAYYWLRLRNTVNDGRDVVVDTKSRAYGRRYGLYVGQYNRGTGMFDICGDDLGCYPESFEVLEMIEYKGNK